MGTDLVVLFGLFLELLEELAHVALDLLVDLVRDGHVLALLLLLAAVQLLLLC